MIHDPSPLLDGEEWRPIAGYEGIYEVSSLGRVRSLRFDPPKIMKQTPDLDGYLRFSLWRDHTLARGKTHQAVCAAFHGARPDGLEVAHLDGNNQNCRAVNLAWVTRAENLAHKQAHGTVLRGETHPRAKLTDSEVIAIRNAVAAGVTARDLARRYGITASSINGIASGKRWRHVGGVLTRRERGGAEAQRGTGNHGAKLAAEQVREMRRRHRGGESAASVARAFGMSRAAGYNAIVGRTYSNVTESAVGGAEAPK